MKMLGNFDWRKLLAGTKQTERVLYANTKVRKTLGKEKQPLWCQDLHSVCARVRGMRAWQKPANTMPRVDKDIPLPHL
jgi:hypothetical protein